MKLYSGPLSLFSAKVRIALAEKDIPYELISVPFSRAHGYSPKHPEVLALNPKGQVPVLVDGELSIYDSTIILGYLEDEHLDVPLLPREPAARARCRQLEAASDEILFPLVWELIDEVFYQPDEAERDALRIERAGESIRREYDRLDAHLKDREFFAAEYSIADIAYFLTIMFAVNLGVAPAQHHQHLQAWLLRVGSRPPVAREIAEMTAASQAA